MTAVEHVVRLSPPLAITPIPALTTVCTSHRLHDLTRMLVDDCFPEKQQPATTHPTLSLSATDDTLEFGWIPNGHGAAPTMRRWL